MAEKSISKSICISFLLFFTLVFLSQASAVNVKVTKSAAESIDINETLEVSIKINNLENTEISVSVKEYVTNADPVQPPSFYQGGKCPYKMCSEPPYYLWNVTLSAVSIHEIKYEVKPLSFGIFSLPPTQVKTSSGETFYSNSLSVAVHCKVNGKCEPDKGENYFTCSEDCPSGSTDDVCDLIKDGRCDSDCTAGADPDCVTPATTTIPTTTTLPVGKTSNLFTYLVIILVIIAVAAFFFLKIKVVR